MIQIASNSFRGDFMIFHFSSSLHIDGIWPPSLNTEPLDARDEATTS